MLLLLAIIALLVLMFEILSRVIGAIINKIISYENDDDTT